MSQVKVIKQPGTYGKWIVELDYVRRVVIAKNIYTNEIKELTPLKFEEMFQISIMDALASERKYGVLHCMEVLEEITKVEYIGR